jgi:hypothetical protein
LITQIDYSAHDGGGIVGITLDFAGDRPGTVQVKTFEHEIDGTYFTLRIAQFKGGEP